MTNADDALFWQLWLCVSPLAVLAGTALYLHFHWDAIPARFPIHWGANGAPNGWATRSLAGVYGPLLLGATIVLFILGILALTSSGSRRSARHPGQTVVPIGVAYVIAASFSLAGLLPLHIVPVRELVAFHIASFSILAAMVWVSLRRHAKTGTAGEEITPEICWHGDQFYYNPRDPALSVDKRIGLGLTLNFGNRASWIVLALMLLIPAGLVFLAFELTKA